jgi:hypothetical protein
VRLRKDISHLFRSRYRPPAAKLDVRAFTEILDVDESEGTVDVEGVASYGKLVDVTLAHGLLPCVVPQLKSITIGGACAGLGIEAASFRYVRIPTKPATNSNRKPATDSDLKPAGIPI